VVADTDTQMLGCRARRRWTNVPFPTPLGPVITVRVPMPSDITALSWPSRVGSPLNDG